METPEELTGKDINQVAAVWAEVPARAAARVALWVKAAEPEQHSLFEDVSQDPDNLSFANRLLQLIAGTEDAVTAAFGLRELAQEIPESVNFRDRLTLQAGSLGALGMPWAVMPLARKWMRERIAHLVVTTTLPGDSTKNSPAAALLEPLKALTAQQTPAVVALTGTPVLGPVASSHELRRLLALSYRPEIEYLLVDISRLVPGSVWGAATRTQRAVTALRQLIQEGSEHGTQVTITAGNYADAKLLRSIVLRLLAEPDLLQHRFGVTLQAEMPEAASMLTVYSVQAASRMQNGGAPLELRIATASTLSEESITAIISGQPVAVLESRAQVEAAALRLLRQAHLTPGLNTVLASDSAYLVAAALEFFAAEQLTVEVRSGLAAELLIALRAAAVPTRVHLPVVSRDEFSGVIPQILRLAAEAADPGAALAYRHALNPLHPGAATAREAELANLERVCELAASAPPLPHRTQDRTAEWDPSVRDASLFFHPAGDTHMYETGGLTAAVLGLSRNQETGEIILDQAAQTRSLPIVSDSGFANEPETDATVAVNRDWFKQQLQDRAAAAAGQLSDSTAPTVIRKSGAKPLHDNLALRARVLRRIALTTAAERDSYTQLFARTTTLSAAAIDAEVNKLIDSARYLAQQAEHLIRVRGAHFLPLGNTLLLSDSANLFGDLLVSFLASFAAGNHNLIGAPNALAQAVNEALEGWRSAGLPAGAAAITASSDPAALALDDSLVNSVVLGSSALREGLQRYAPGLRTQGRFTQVGVAAVTTAADIDSSVRAIVASAFTGADSGLRSIRAVVAQGAMYRSEHFRAQLADAVRQVSPFPAAAFTGGSGVGVDSLQVFAPKLDTPPTAAQLRALTTLERGETWLVTPRQIDDAGLVWSPGVKLGVRAESDFWDVAATVPVLGVLRVSTMQEVISVSNQVGSGAVAALFSWDPDEIIPWAEEVRAASLTVNRATTEARVERLPSGAWGLAGSGVATLSGGPHELLGLGAWKLREGTASSTLHLRGLDPEITALIETTQEWLSYHEYDMLRRAALSDALTWRTQLGIVRDVAALGVEHNVLRYWPVPTVIRLAEDQPLEPLVRVLSAALLVGAPITVSTGTVLPDSILELLERQQAYYRLESDDVWLESVAVSHPDAGGRPAERIRLIGGDAAQLSEWLSARPNIGVWAEEVTLAGPVELLTFLAEQSLSITNHRYGIMWELPEVRDWLLELGR
ncbi:proline dehydrogenase family protein [Canibacter zhoujuaniae]|uniref:proline dehydrogenase family protein n=1 Tax=Canibacter zhoujuaniae TaxID=2708343 RepID=UPI001422471C|nr:proline dehydrogenase family protein [Canibacter zhoujuaniae]